MSVSTATPELMDYDEAVARFDPVLGLEVHVELSTATKMFCACPTEFGAEPNTQVCPVCLGMPGSLPVVNRVAVESAMRIVASTAARLATGRLPGRPRQTGQTCVLGSAPNSVAQPQNILLAVPSSTCVSRPMTGSNSASASA